jgi:hypothetical protein
MMPWISTLQIQMLKYIRRFNFVGIMSFYAINLDVIHDRTSKDRAFLYQGMNLEEDEFVERKSIIEGR